MVICPSSGSSFFPSFRVQSHEWRLWDTLVTQRTLGPPFRFKYQTQPVSSVVLSPQTCFVLSVWKVREGGLVCSAVQLRHDVSPIIFRDILTTLSQKSTNSTQLYHFFSHLDYHNDYNNQPLFSQTNPLAQRQPHTQQKIQLLSCVPRSRGGDGNYPFGRIGYCCSLCVQIGGQVTNNVETTRPGRWTWGALHGLRAWRTLS